MNIIRKLLGFLGDLAGGPVTAAAVVQAAISLLIGFGIHVSAHETGVILGAVTLVVSAVLKFRVDPGAPAAWLGLVSAAGTVLVAFRVPHITSGEIAALVSFIATLVAAATHSSFTAVKTIPHGPAKAGSGVRGAYLRT